MSELMITPIGDTEIHAKWIIEGMEKSDPLFDLQFSINQEEFIKKYKPGTYRILGRDAKGEIIFELVELDECSGWFK